MYEVVLPEFIKCKFDPAIEIGLSSFSENTEIFYAETKSLHSIYNELEKYISYHEKIKAEKIISHDVKETYIVSHALLRLFLAHFLNIDPVDIPFTYSENKKPLITGNPIYFNLSHTNGAFAFALSSTSPIGVDIEKINQRVEIHSVVKSFFSKNEHDFVYSSANGIYERFFLLWTRKEALLKAVGTGMINNLEKIEVAGNENVIPRNIFEGLTSSDFSNNYFIYTMKPDNCYISVAIPYYSSVYIHPIEASVLQSLLKLK